MKELQFQREALNQRGCNTEAVDELVFQIAACQSEDAAKNLFALLELEADKLDWPRDRDYAAVALQVALPTANKLVASEMLKFAINRAQLCASCATSGGEGLARSEHIHELKKL